MTVWSRLISSSIFPIRYMSFHNQAVEKYHAVVFKSGSKGVQRFPSSQNLSSQSVVFVSYFGSPFDKRVQMNFKPLFCYKPCSNNYENDCQSLYGYDFFPVSSFKILGTNRLRKSVIAKTKNGSNDPAADTKDTGPLEIAM